MHNPELLQKLDKLLNAYSHQYDIARDVTVDGGFFPATATFYLRDENYIINKKHVLSAVENYDYTYFLDCTGSLHLGPGIRLVLL